MEYAFALITPNGYASAVTNNIVKDIIKEGFESGLLSLICVYDLSNDDIKKIYERTHNIEFSNQLKKSMDNKFIVPLFFRGENAISKVKKIVSKYNNGKTNEQRYFDNIYVSNDSIEAVVDLCYHYDVEDFENIEDLLFKNIDSPLETFPFKELSRVTKEKTN